jgi:hypothetical protein
MPWWVRLGDLWRNAMTRFKELRRIENAIEHKNEADLRWALSYCAMRIKLAGQIATMKRQGAEWRRVEKKVRAALVEVQTQADSYSHIPVRPFLGLNVI